MNYSNIILLLFDAAVFSLACQLQESTLEVTMKSNCSVDCMAEAISAKPKHLCNFTYVRSSINLIEKRRVIHDANISLENIFFRAGKNQ